MEANVLNYPEPATAFAKADHDGRSPRVSRFGATDRGPNGRYIMTRQWRIPRAIQTTFARTTGLAVLIVSLCGMSGRPLASEDPPIFLLKWGTAGTGDGQFLSCFGLAADPLGNVFVTDAQNDRVQKFTDGGVFLLKWGQTGSGDGDLDGPGGIASLGADVVYVADLSGVQKFNGSGEFLESFVGGGVAIDVDPTGQFIYAVGANGVIQYATDGAIIRSWTTTDDSRASNRGVAVGPSGHVYVAEGGAADVVYKYTADGVLVDQWGGSGSGDGLLRSPHGVAVDADENVYVCDSQNARIQKFTSDGVLLTKWGSGGTEDGQFLFASDVAVDGDGNVYVADVSLNRIQKFGQVATPTLPTTWGGLKALYRGPSVPVTR